MFNCEKLKNKAVYTVTKGKRDSTGSTREEKKKKII